MENFKEKYEEVLSKIRQSSEQRRLMALFVERCGYIHMKIKPYDGRGLITRRDQICDMFGNIDSDATNNLHIVRREHTKEHCVNDRNKLSIKTEAVMMTLPFFFETKEITILRSCDLENPKCTECHYHLLKVFESENYIIVVQLYRSSCRNTDED